MKTKAKAKAKVLVNGHDLKFFTRIQLYLESTGLFEFRKDVWSGHNTHDEQFSNECVKWADIIICEWCLGNAVWYCNNKKPNQRLIIRYHLQERELEYPKQLDQNKVDKIIFVGPHIIEEAIEKQGIRRDKTILIHNFVNFNEYNQPKYADSEFNLGIVGISPRRKRLDRAVEVLKQLYRIDQRYKLHIKGAHPTQYSWLWKRTKEREYYTKLFEGINASEIRNNVVFDPFAPDIDKWFKMIGFILSPSDFESFHMAIPEGMSSGTYPVIWNWDGANEIYGSKYLVKSNEEAVNKILKARSLIHIQMVKRTLQKYVIDNFDTQVICKQWLEMLLPEMRGGTNVFSCSSSDKKRLLLVVFAIDNWATFHRKEMLEALAKNIREKCDVLIIEPRNSYTELQKREDNSLEELDRFLQLKPIKVEENIFLFKHIIFNYPQNKKYPDEEFHGLENKIWLKKRIELMFPEHDLLYWIYKPDLIGRYLYQDDPYLYECYDDYTINFGTGEEYEGWKEMEKHALLKAHASFFTSSYLYDIKGEWCGRSFYTENGLPFSLFNNYANVKKLKKKTVGFLGNLSDFFNWVLIIEVAERLKDIDFFFYGPIDGKALKQNQEQVKQLQAMSNCKFLGRVNRKDGANKIARHDCLIIPFIDNEAMDAVNPLKLWEYFALGIPVVSSPMKAIKYLSELVYFAYTPEEWATQIKKAINEKNDTKKRKRIKLAAEHDWVKLTKTHTKVIEEFYN